MSDFLLDLHQSLAHQGFVKIRTEPRVCLRFFTKPYAYDLGTSFREKSLILGLILSPNLCSHASFVVKINQYSGV
jgi:hypothetical protein